MHVHSTFSVDGKNNLMSMRQAAIKEGLGYIRFTEHFDMNPRDYGFDYFAFEKFSEAIDVARDEFAGTISILKGLEFSEPHLYPREFETMLKKDFDVILGAVHWLGQFTIDQKELEENFGQKEILEKYYMEVLEATNTCQ